MGKKKKKKNIQINNGIIAPAPSMAIDVDQFRLPQTLGNPPKQAQILNDKAFNVIRPQLESFVMDNAMHSLKAMGVLTYADATFLGYGALANLSQNGLIRAGVEMRGDEMTRKWGELSRQGEDEEEDDKINKLTEAMKKLKIREMFRSASCMCGYFGGCLMFIDNGDKKENLVNPLTLHKSTFAMGRLKTFRLIEPYLVTPSNYNSVNPMADDYFKPQIWFIQGVPVHNSRLIYFAENKLSTLLMPAYNFFGMPLAQKVLDAVGHYTQNREAAQRLLQKYALTILKTNMEGVLQNGFDNELKKRIQYFVQNRSNDGCATIDKELEDLVVQTTSLAGVTDLVRQSMEYVAAMFNEPVTKMWGLSPAGFSSGDVELRNHYDNVKAQQEKMFGDAIQKVLQVLQINLFGEIDESIVFTFNPLAEDDEHKIAETNKLQVDTDSALINAGVITPEEARKRLIDDENSGYNALSEEKEEMPEEVEPFEEEDEDIRKNDTKRGVRDKVQTEVKPNDKRNAQGNPKGNPKFAE